MKFIRILGLLIGLFFFSAQATPYTYFPTLLKTAKLISLNDDATTKNATQGGGEASNAILVSLQADGTSVGAVKIHFIDGTSITFPYISAGIWINMAPFDHVYSTGTTANTVIVGRTF